MNVAPSSPSASAGVYSTRQTQTAHLEENTLPPCFQMWGGGVPGVKMKTREKQAYSKTIIPPMYTAQ